MNRVSEKNQQVWLFQDESNQAVEIVSGVVFNFQSAALTLLHDTYPAVQMVGQLDAQILAI